MSAKHIQRPADEPSIQLAQPYMVHSSVRKYNLQAMSATKLLLNEGVEEKLVKVIMRPPPLKSRDTETRRLRRRGELSL